MGIACCVVDSTAHPPLMDPPTGYDWEDATLILQHILRHCTLKHNTKIIVLTCGDCTYVVYSNGQGIEGAAGLRLGPKMILGAGHACEKCFWLVMLLTTLCLRLPAEHSPYLRSHPDCVRETCRMRSSRCPKMSFVYVLDCIAYRAVYTCAIHAPAP